MSGYISLKPYYLARDKRKESFFKLLNLYVPINYPVDVLHIIVMYAMWMDDLDIIEEQMKKQVDDMNLYVNNVWKRCCLLLLDSISAVEMLKVYYISGADEYFMRDLMHPSLDRVVYAAMPDDPRYGNFGDFICKQLCRIRTRNKLYKRKHDIYKLESETFRKRFRCMLLRDQDTLTNIERIIALVDRTQQNLNYEDFRKAYSASLVECLEREYPYHSRRERMVIALHKNLYGLIH